MGATHGDRGPDGVDARSWPWRSAVRIRSVTLGTAVHRSRRGRRPRRSHKPSDPGSTPGAATMPVLLGWPSACLVIRSPRVRLSPPAPSLAISSLIGSGCCADRDSFSDLDVVGSSPADGCDTCRSSKAEHQTVSSSDLVLRPNQSAGPLRGLGVLHLWSDTAPLTRRWFSGRTSPVRCEERGSFW